LPLFIYCTHII
jgi:hypothetical protein